MSIEKLNMKKFRDDRFERITKRLNQLKSKKARIYFLAHLDYPQREKAQYETLIKEYLLELEEIIPEVRSIIRSYRKYIPHIWDQSNITAAYLLIGKAFHNLITLIQIAKTGANYEIVELSRSAIESLDLALLILEESDNKKLTKWFKGEIIQNKVAREKYQEVINRFSTQKTSKPIKFLKSEVYDLYSYYTHSGYLAILESVDPFYEDLDYKSYAGFYFTYRNLELISNVLINILFELKTIYLKSKDLVYVKKIDQLLNKAGHKNMSDKDIDKFLNITLNNKMKSRTSVIIKQ